VPGLLFYRNPRLTALLVGLILVAGGAALASLARQEDPTLARRFATITTFHPGASALRVESLVTEPIEEQVRELHEVKEIASVSRTGVSLITVELDDEYGEEDVDEIWSKVRDKLGDVGPELPPGAGAPEFEDRTSTAVTLLAALAWDRDDAPPMGLLTRLARELENRLRNVPGTKETELFGEAREEVRVEVDPVALAAANLTAAEVAGAIARADAKVPAGQLRGAGSDLLLEVEGELTSLERIRRIPVREEDGARSLRVGELGRVAKTVREPPETLALVAGRRGVVVAATMESGRRVDRWAEQAREVLESFRTEVPRGVAFETIFDQSIYTERRLGTLAGNLVMGAGIVVAVLFVMMGARSALVVATALPITVAAVLAELNLLGVPLHQTSITGLIIALGLLIDNAIVVVDEYTLRARRGLPPADAVAETLRHLRVPLAASTFTTVLAFLPIVLMPGPAGEFVGPISIGVGLSVTTSYLVSLTVIAALAGLTTPRGGPAAAGGAWWREGYAHPRLTAVYRRSLVAVLRRPSLGVAVALVLPLLGFAAGSTLPEQFFPANDRNQFQVQLVLPSHVSLAETRRQAERARRLLRAHDEILESHWFLGESAPRVFYNMFGADEGVSSYAGAFVTTRSAAATEDLLPGLQRELIEAFPEARVIALPFEQGPPFEAPIEVRLVGPDLEELRRLGEQVRRVLSRSEAVTYTTARLAGGEPTLMLATDEDEARGAGLRLVDVAEQLDALLQGALGGTVLEVNEELPVRVRVEDPDRARLPAILAGRALASSRPSQGSAQGLPGVPLGVLSEVRLVPELAEIPRRDGERVNTVQAFLQPYALIADSLEDVQRRLAASGFALPSGYRLEYGGEREERSEAVSGLLAFALPLFVLMGGSIVLAFDSFRLAGIVFAVGALSVGLALGGVWLFGHPMGFVAIVGTMGLVGLAINGAIVVLSALRADPRARRADVEAGADVVLAATRHILATTFTTIGGFLPLIVFGGRFWPPMATAIAGGVGGAAILALYFVPSVYTAIRRRAVGRATPPEPGEPAFDGPDGMDDPSSASGTDA